MNELKNTPLTESQGGRQGYTLIDSALAHTISLAYNLFSHQPRKGIPFAIAIRRDPKLRVHKLAQSDESKREAEQLVIKTLRDIDRKRALLVVSRSLGRAGVTPENQNLAIFKRVNLQDTSLLRMPDQRSPGYSPVMNRIILPPAHIARFLTLATHMRNVDIISNNVRGETATPLIGKYERARIFILMSLVAYFHEVAHALQANYRIGDDNRNGIGSTHEPAVEGITERLAHEWTLSYLRQNPITTNGIILGPHEAEKIFEKVDHSLARRNELLHYTNLVCEVAEKLGIPNNTADDMLVRLSFRPTTTSSTPSLDALQIVLGKHLGYYHRDIQRKGESWWQEKRKQFLTQ